MSIFLSCLRSRNIAILVFDCIGRFGFLFVEVPCTAVMAILCEMVLGGEDKMLALILCPFLPSHAPAHCVVLALGC